MEISRTGGGSERDIAARRLGLTPGAENFSLRPRGEASPLAPRAVPIASSDDFRILLMQIRGGDRDAGALLMSRYGPLLRQRFRRRLSPGLRRLMDSTDLMSTVTRRFDQAVVEHRAWFENEDQLWAFLKSIARNVIADKARVLQRLNRAEGPDSNWARAMAQRTEQGDPSRSDERFGEVIEFALASLESEVDRRVLSLWLAGMSFSEIAFEVDQQPNAIHQRWFRLRGRLALAFGVPS